MSTVSQLRTAIKLAATHATEDAPDKADDRARCFIESLTGSMNAMNETMLEQILLALLGMPAGVTQ